MSIEVVFVNLRKSGAQRRLRFCGRHIFLLLLMWWLIGPGLVGAQSSTATGAVGGAVYVLDSEGTSYVPGAKVILQGSKTIQTETDEKGRYSFQAVEAGAYTITVSFPSLEGAQEITIPAGAAITVDLELKPVAVQTSVTVSDTDTNDAKAPTVTETITEKTVAYKEWDSFNIWQAGRAAFMRNWPNAYVSARAENSPTKDRFEIAPLPAGRAGSAATLGGQGYGVSRYSSHPREAAMLVRFLTSRAEQARRCREPSGPPTIPELYHDSEVLKQNPYFKTILLAFTQGEAVRPSTVAGKNYPQVSRAYFEAVNAVLSHKESASEAAAQLQLELEQIVKKPAGNPSAGVRQEGALAQR